MQHFRVEILGCRGSMPVDGTSFQTYGGATSCIAVHTKDQVILLDAGTGIFSLTNNELPTKQVSILFSHFHLDHICGLFTSPLLFDEEMTVDLYAKNATLQVLSKVMTPPLWPVGPTAFSATVQDHIAGKRFSLGAVTVETMESNHPNGGLLYRLTCEGSSLVYLTDCEIDPTNMEDLVTFCADADLLLCDGQYTPAQRLEKQGFGHSDWQTAALLAKQSGVKTLRIIHHDPTHTDHMLDAMQTELQQQCQHAAFAVRKEVVLI